MMAKILNDYLFDRKLELEGLVNFINDQKSNYLFIQGEAGLGKTCLVTEFFKKYNPTEGTYLFLNVNDLNNFMKVNEMTFDIQYLKSLKVIFIDNCENCVRDTSLNEAILKFAGLCAKNNIKLIFLSNQDYQNFIINEIKNNIFSNLALNKLQLTDIFKQYPTLSSLSSVMPQFINILTIPFYLNLIVKHQLDLSKFEHEMGMSLEDYIMQLAIEKPANRVDEPKTTKLKKERKIVLRKLAYSKGKSNNLTKTPMLDGYQQAVISLVKDGLLIEQANKSYDFSHNLINIWALKQIINKKLRQSIDADDEPGEIFKFLEGHFHSFKYEWTKELYKHPLLLKHLENKYNSLFNNKCDSYSNLILIAFMQPNLIQFNNCLEISFEFLSELNPDMAIVVVASLCARNIFKKGLPIEIQKVIYKSLRVLFLQEKTFTIAALTILEVLSKYSLPEINDSLSHFFVTSFCHTACRTAASYEARFKFLEEHKNDDTSYQQYVCEALYYAANPCESGSTCGEEHYYLLDGTIIEPYDTTHRDSKTKEIYIHKSLALLIECYHSKDDIIADKAKEYILDILKDTIGSTYYVLTDEKKTPRIYDTPLDILKSVRLDSILIKSVKEIVQDKKNSIPELREGAEMEHPSKDDPKKIIKTIIIPNIEEHIKLMLAQFSEIEKIITQRFSPDKSAELNITTQSLTRNKATSNSYADDTSINIIKFDSLWVKYPKYDLTIIKQKIISEVSNVNEAHVNAIALSYSLTCLGYNFISEDTLNGYMSDDDKKQKPILLFKSADCLEKYILRNYKAFGERIDIDSPKNIKQYISGKKGILFFHMPDSKTLPNQVALWNGSNFAKSEDDLTENQDLKSAVFIKMS